MRRSSDAAYWLALLSASELKRSVAKSVVGRWCLEGNHSLAALFALGVEDAQRELGLDERQARQLLATKEHVPAQVALLDELDSADIGVITRNDVAYPEALSERFPEERLPYFLFYRGNLTILTQPALSILGAAEPSTDAATAARDLAKALMEDEHPLVGGYGKGIDRLALDAIRQAGGETAIVLPLGIRRFGRALAGMAAALDEGRALVMSPYAPDAEYAEPLARASLALVASLSELVFLVAPEAGSVAMLREAMADNEKMLFWSGEAGEGSVAAREAGALPFADAVEAREHVRRLTGLSPAEAEEPSGERAVDEALYTLDEPDDTPPIAFDDADSAIEALRRSGRVPDALIRRLREADWGDKNKGKK